MSTAAWSTAAGVQEHGVQQQNGVMRHFHFYQIPTSHQRKTQIKTKEL